jgi:hypothetical protein
MARNPTIPPIAARRAPKPWFALALTLAAAVDAGPEEVDAFVVGLTVAELEEPAERVGLPATVADFEDPAEDVGADDEREVGTLLEVGLLLEVAGAVLGERTYS